MRIALVNSQDLGGGAAGFTRQLAGALLNRGHEVAVLVGIKRTSLPWVHEIPVSGGGGATERLLRFLVRRLWPGKPDESRVHYLARRLLHARNLRGTLARRGGLEDFRLPGTMAAFDRLPFKPDVVHLNNLHEFVGPTHFNIEALPSIAQKSRLVYTLHDAWPFTGHCVYFFSCQRWRQSCGECPHLHVPVSLPRDETSANLRAKSKLYSEIGLTLTAPSSWMLSCALGSILKPAIRNSAVVPYGIDLDFFRPADNREAVRRELGIKQGERTLCFVADKGRHTPWRDFGFVEGLARRYGEAFPKQRLVVLEVGSTIRDEFTGAVRLMGTGPLAAEGVRQVFRAADLMVYPARADNYPYVILEALACGTPVLASRVGGIPEEIIEGEDGMLFMPGNLPEAMGCLTRFLKDPSMQESMRRSARQHAVRAFDLGRMASDYERLYADPAAGGRPS